MIRDLIGDPEDGRRSSMTAVKTIEVPSLSGGMNLKYKHSPATTFATEELIELLKNYGGSIAHIVMHLKDSQTRSAQTSRYDFNWFKGRISRAFKRALGPEAKGLFVLERDKQSWAEKLARKSPGLHLHAVIYIPIGFDEKVRKRMKQSFKDLVDNRNLNNALVARTAGTKYRVDESYPNCIHKEVSELDLGLADYLCKELDKPIVDGCSNLSLFNMGKIVNTRRRWRYEQLQALRAELTKIECESYYSTDVGDVNSRLERAVDSVPRPKGLVVPPRTRH